MELVESARYLQAGLTAEALGRLALLGDLLLGAEINVTGVREPLDVEHQHFLDSLTLLSLPAVRHADSLADVGSGGGLPALVVALALPEVRVTALESVAKKCAFIEQTAAQLGLPNIDVVCARAEQFGRVQGRAGFDVVVARAVASLPVLAELCMPLVRIGGTFVAMKSALSDQERIRGERALAILGAGPLTGQAVDPFPGGDRRWLYAAQKTGETPDAYPRRVGVPGRKPLGGAQRS